MVDIDDNAKHALLAAFEKILKEDDEFISNFRRVMAVTEEVEALEQEPTTKNDLGVKEFESYVKCSICGKCSIDQRTYVAMNFCPNCGADMRWE